MTAFWRYVLKSWLTMVKWLAGFLAAFYVAMSLLYLIMEVLPVSEIVRACLVGGYVLLLILIALGIMAYMNGVIEFDHNRKDRVTGAKRDS